MPALLFAADAGNIPVSKRFKAQLPGKDWRHIHTTADLKLRSKAKVELYYKKKNGSFIIVRSGRSGSHGLSSFFSDLSADDAEMIYLIKLLPKGDFIDEVALTNQTKLLSHAKAYAFKVEDTKLGSFTNIVVFVRGGDIVLIELLAKPDNYEQDKIDFFNFLKTLKEVH